MGDIIGLIIFIFVMSRVIGAAKKKDRNPKKTVQRGNPPNPENKGYSSYNEKEETYDSAKNTITQRMAKPSQKATQEESLTEIEKRRKQQHESHMDKRIHRNVHADDERWEEEGVVNEMKTIRDLMVCGYPTEIPNQRDFIKEGEDFLAGLSSNSLFF